MILTISSEKKNTKTTVNGITRTYMKELEGNEKRQSSNFITNG